MAKLIWKITGYLGDKSIYERVVRRGALSQKAMVTLLQRLASRHLSEDEVVSSSLKKDDRDYCSALEIRRNYGGRDALMTTGSGHYYTALVERAETKPPTRRPCGVGAARRDLLAGYLFCDGGIPPSGVLLHVCS